MRKLAQIGVLIAVLIVEVGAFFLLFSTPSLHQSNVTADKAGNIDNFKKPLQLIATTQPKNESMILLVNKALTLSEAGRFEEALEVTDICLQTFSEKCRLEGLKGYLLHRLERYEEALKWYDKALEIYPDSYDWLFGKAYCLDRLGRYQEALEPLDRILKANSNDVTVLNNKAWALSQLGNYNEALEIVNFALDKDGDNMLEAAVLHTKVYILYKTNRYQEALEVSDECLESAPNYEPCVEYRQLTLDKINPR